MPPIHLINVVLPAPLSPTRAVTSPAFAVKWTDDNTLPGPNDLSTPRSSNVAVTLVTDAVGGAQLLQCRGRADGGGGQVAVGHRLGDVSLGDHRGRGQERGHLAAGRRVLGGCRRRRLLPGEDLTGQLHRLVGLAGDWLVDGEALGAGHDVVETAGGGVLPGHRHL